VNVINSNEDISLKILAYLLNNPNAQDTLEGISEWWLLDQDIKNELPMKVLNWRLTYRELEPY